MTTLVIDGDILVHLACRYDRWQTKCKKEGKYLLVNLNEEGTKEHLEYTKREDEKYMRESWENFEKLVNTLVDELWAIGYFMAVKGEGNFRHDLYSEYKANRARQKEKRPDNRSKFVNAITKLAVLNGYATPADGMEADDLVRIKAEELRESGEDFTIVTIDKDLRCIPGKFYDPKKKEHFEISEEEATKFYYEQLLSGDSSDNIPGVPGVGPINAQKMLAGINSEEEYQEIVVSNYLAAYEDDWEVMLELNGKLLYILKSIDDSFSMADWPIVKELKE